MGISRIQRVPWTVQPQVAAQINSGNPIAASSTVVINPALGLRNLVTGRALTNPLALTPGPRGIGLTQTVSSAMNVAVSVTAWPYAIYCIQTRNGNGNWVGLSSTASNVTYNFFRGDVSSTDSVTVGDGTDTQVNVSPVPSSAPHTYLFVARSATDRSLYIDGVLVATNATSKSTPAYDRFNLGGLERTVGGWLGFQTNQLVLAGLSQGITITDAQAIEFTRNPWGTLFDPIQRKTFSLVSLNPGGIWTPRRSYQLGTTPPPLTTSSPIAVRRTPWTVQPQVAVGINKSHTLTQGLVFAAVPIGGSWVDLISGKTATGNSSQVLRTSDGFSGRTNIASKGPGSATAPSATFSGLTGADTLTSQLSIFSISSLEVNGVAAAILESRDPATGDGFRFMHDDGLLVADSLYYYANNGTAIVSSAAIDTSTELYTYRSMLTSDATASNFYIKGVFYTTRAGITPTANAGRRTTIGGLSGATHVTSISLVLAWARVLALAEYRALYANPWQIFAPLTLKNWGPA